MMNELNEMYIRRRNKVMVCDKPINCTEVIDKRVIATGIKNLEAYGYTLSQEIISYYASLPEHFFVELYKEIMPIIKFHTGADRVTEPMYPNFPKQVMEADESELYLNAIIHYATCGELVPSYEKEERFPFEISADKLTVINLGSGEDFETIFTNLLSSKASLSEADKSDINWFIQNLTPETIERLMPKEITMKETLSYVTDLLWDTELKSALIPYYKTATDVLRLATALSDGDVSLSEHSFYKSFRRSERRILLTMLERCNNIEEDMMRHKMKWIRLGEVLHPGEYKKFKKVNEAFYKLRNEVKIETFNSNIEKAFEDKDIDRVIKLLKNRPGEFARRLDRALRLAETKDDSNKVVRAFSDIADKIPTPLLLQLQEYFTRRGENRIEQRVFFPKGSTAKAYGIENNLKELDSTTCKRIVDICQLRLMNEYSKKDYLGKVYIDKELKNYIAPMSQRTASKSLKSVARGSKMPIDKEANILRHFVYWKNNDYRVDVDLSVVAYNEDFDMLTNVYYCHLKDNQYGLVHSGDFVSSYGEGATEYIDIDINKAKLRRVRYLAVVINSFTNDFFSDMEDCFMGFMYRDNAQSGEVFDARTVVNKTDITAESTQVVSTIIDLEEMAIYWADLPLTSSTGLNNINSNQSGIGYTLKSILNICKPNLYDLIEMNALARGELVFSREEADVVFALDGDITPYDTDIIVSEYL